MRAGELERARASFAQQAWKEAYEGFSAGEQSALSGSDLEGLATSAFMLGLEEDYFSVLERAYRVHLDAGEVLPAVRSAFWIGVNLAQRGKPGLAGGWLGRAQRLLERERVECVEAGYLLLPLVFRQEAGGEVKEAAATAAKAAALGERFGDPDLFALAAHEHAHLLIRLGVRQEGLALLDEVMLAVVSGDLSPIVSGIVYCGAILACQDAHEPRRAREWTAAFSGWCARQPDLVAFTGRCLVHRAEIMQLHGAWAEALDEARRAVERCLRGENPGAAGEACYRRGELQRLRGELRAAEDAYREASRYGREPQPGFALLRLAQRKPDAAEAAIRRVEAATFEPSRRARLLPAYVEIMLSVNDLEAAHAACSELESLAHGHEEGVLAVAAAHAKGAVELAEGQARAAQSSLRRAFDGWQRVEAPYEAARTRVLIGQVCRELGDDDAAMLELEAARDAFATLGAATDLTRVLMLLELTGGIDHQGLTQRELEVLRHLAAGETNKAIAAELVLSTRTVDRHVSNIYRKLGVSSRAAATAYAHEHALV